MLPPRWPTVLELELKVVSVRYPCQVTCHVWGWQRIRKPSNAAQRHYWWERWTKFLEVRVRPSEEELRRRVSPGEREWALPCHVRRGMSQAICHGRHVCTSVRLGGRGWLRNGHILIPAVFAFIHKEGDGHGKTIRTEGEGQGHHGNRYRGDNATNRQATCTRAKTRWGQRRDGDAVDSEGERQRSHRGTGDESEPSSRLHQVKQEDEMMALCEVSISSPFHPLNVLIAYAAYVFVTISDSLRFTLYTFLFKDDRRAHVKWSISPGDQSTPVWVSTRHTHTELSLFFLFQGGNVQFINIWSLLIERICATSLLGGSLNTALTLILCVVSYSICPFVHLCQWNQTRMWSM